MVEIAEKIGLFEDSLEAFNDLLIDYSELLQECKEYSEEVSYLENTYFTRVVQF
tara:strand:+ start:18 stop:179 length:162 start_codon:yes stop_codon:yes gene_type:complete